MLNFKLDYLLTYTDISNDVLLNTFTYMKRIDDVFGTGSFSFESKTISGNIAPYTTLVIDDDYFLCSSEATYHYGNQSWIHNVSMIEATSILSRFLVGSKAFSVTGTNTYDYEKIDILLKLINDKYGVNITYKTPNKWKTLTKQIEFVFTAGTTLYDALNEILKNYNMRVQVTKIIGIQDIEIDYLNLSTLDDIELPSNNILSKTYIQNAEKYCKFLETEATNVIDTTNTTIADNLYPTANDIKLSEDTYMLKVPTPIYKVKRMWADLYTQIMVELTFPENISTIDTYKTYEQWTDIYPDLYDLWNVYFYNYYPDWNSFKKQEWKASFKKLVPTTNQTFGGIMTERIKTRVDITNKVLSKEQYDLVEDKNKPDFIYYSLGSNVIDGFNVFYKNDFWSTIIGDNNKPFFLEMGFSQRPYANEINPGVNGIKIAEFVVASLDSEVFKRTYGVEYYPIANPFLTSKKNDYPINELGYKPFALSFGKSSNYTDFDKLLNAMDIENKSSGKTEMVLEYDVTDQSFLKPYRKINVEGNDWYVANIQYKVTATQSIATLNLVSNYNKVADVISLNSQYNTVKNPLQDIIERPLYLELDKTFEFTQGTTYFVVKFEFANNASKEVIVSPIIMQNNGNQYFYFEMADQYSAGDTIKDVENQTVLFKVDSVPYVDSNNEAIKYSITKVDFKNINYSIAKQLPKAPNGWSIGNPYQSLTTDSIVIYKDAREKLTFTIKANNCIIK